MLLCLFNRYTVQIDYIILFHLLSILKDVLHYRDDARYAFGGKRGLLIVPQMKLATELVDFLLRDLRNTGITEIGNQMKTDHISVFDIA